MTARAIKHPATFSKAVLRVLPEMLEGYTTVLDPFAGTGKIHELQPYGYRTVGIELEPEWAEYHPDTRVGERTGAPVRRRHLRRRRHQSVLREQTRRPPQGQRRSLRRSYTHDLGRDLHPDNAGLLQWGPAYQHFHERAWVEVLRVLRPGGLFLLNIKDHVRNKKVRPVSDWHRKCLVGLGLRHDPERSRFIPTLGLRLGTNRNARTSGEWVLVFRKPSS